MTRISLVLLAALLCLLGNPGPTSAALNQTSGYTFRGKYAEAAYFTEDSCTFTSVYVGAGEQVAKSGPGKRQETRSIFAYVSIWDACAGTGTFGSGWADLSASEWSADAGRKLDTVKAKKSFDICLYDDYGNPTGVCFQLAVDLTWTGTGDQYVSRGHWLNRWPGFKIISNNNSTSRDATVSGSVVSPIGTDYAAPGVSYGYISYSSGGYREFVGP